nr:Dyp-type peroxidase [Geodermatophilaceae bacterium]
RRQTGILAAGSSYGLVAAFTCTAADRATLAETLRAVSAEIEVLMSGGQPEDDDPRRPPPDNGVLDSVEVRLDSATLSVGASLFDDRYGLAALKPAELVAMPVLANDRLDPARTHGDLLLQVQAEHPDVCLHALRRIMRETRGGLVVHWLLDTFTRPDSQPLGGQTDTRNLLGFKDGTANPDITQDDLMDDVVWATGGDSVTGAAEPAWTEGGSYLAVRVVRMLVEFWDRTSLREQESIIGRHRRTGAPLGMADEADTPNYVDDPDGAQIPLDAHIRLANPRDGSPALMLRRGASYSRGVDASGQLDQGLAFLSYQRSLSVFLATSERLKGEPLEEYIRPEGGGFFFTLPGPGRDGWLGQSLLG